MKLNNEMVMKFNYSYDGKFDFQSAHSTKYATY